MKKCTKHSELNLPDDYEVDGDVTLTIRGKTLYLTGTLGHLGKVGFFKGPIFHLHGKKKKMASGLLEDYINNNFSEEIFTELVSYWENDDSYGIDPNKEANDDFVRTETAALRRRFNV